jgi:hypothetical protein
MTATAAPVASLSATTRALMWLAAVLFAVLGVVLFCAPSWAADNFPWEVSHFVAMTIGGWSIGTAAWAAIGARSARVDFAWACVLYLGAFGLLELIVVVWHHKLLDTEPALTWLYLAAMVVALIAGGLGTYECARHVHTRPRRSSTSTRSISTAVQAI